MLAVIVGAIYNLSQQIQQSQITKASYTDKAQQTVNGTHILTDGCQNKVKTQAHLYEESFAHLLDAEFRESVRKVALARTLDKINCDTVSNNKEEIKDVKKIKVKEVFVPQELELPTLENKFGKTQTTWGDYLNPSHNIPTNGYDAYFVNSQQPKKVIDKRNLPKIAISYISNDFLGIPSELFQGYWVGKLKIKEEGYYKVSFKKSWGTGRILIDKYVILESGRFNTSDEVYLQPKDYILEVEYQNKRHTVDMSANVDLIKKLELVE